MMKTFGLFALLLCIALPSAQSKAQIFQPVPPPETARHNGRIGTLIDVEGTAAITPRGGLPALARTGMPVYLNDIIQTGKKSRAFILLIDNTSIVLSSNALFTAAKYVYDPAEGTAARNNAFYSVEGDFEYVGGRIGRREKPDVQLNTMAGLINILHGGDVWSGKIDGKYALTVNKGQVLLTTRKGAATLDKGMVVFMPDRFSAPSAPAALSPDLFRRMSASVRLKNYTAAVSRLHALQADQLILRRQYLAYLRRAHADWLTVPAKKKKALSGAAKNQPLPQNKKQVEKDKTSLWRQRWQAWREAHIESRAAENTQAGNPQAENAPTENPSPTVSSK